MLFLKSAVIGKKYRMIERIGSGGNGIVYKVENLETKELLALKTIKINLKTLNKNMREQVRIFRFINEIIAVMEVQEDLEGILPILDFSLPKSLETLLTGDVPYYVMPIAVTLKDKIKESNDIEAKVSCILDLSLTLDRLHTRGIAHRDIKPENIYFYNNRWCLSDFGLVKYPNKEMLTLTNEAVGPWTTLAPEMKRNAKYADPKPADIYSLAKTLWMLLTRNYKGFDGQYSYKNNNVTLENFYSNNIHLTTLHQLLSSSTSDIPEERPSAKNFYKSIKLWFAVKDTFEERSKIEWDFILKEISPSNADSITWKKLNSICTVLDSVSKLNSLNHTFLPDNGGLDLRGCVLSKDEGYLELDLDGEIRKLKPKSLYLKTFNDPQWNYFFLETENIPPSGIYNYESLDQIFKEDLLEVVPGSYIEPYYSNYGEYNGKVLPASSRNIMLGLKGNYVIFPKNSFYNLNMDSYSAYQTKYDTPEKFNGFIIKVIDALDWRENNPQEVERIRKEQEMVREQERERYILNHDNEKSKTKEFLINYDFSFCKSLSKKSNEKLIYFLDFNINCAYNFYITKKFNLEIKEEGWEFDLESLFNPRKEVEKHLVLYKWSEVIGFIEKIINDFDNFTKGFETIGGITVSVKTERIKKPVTLFSKKDLAKLILNGNDQFMNTIVVNENGELELISSEEVNNYVSLKKYPVIGPEFYPRSNDIGPLSKYTEEELSRLYLYLLDAWHRHLIDGRRKTLYDYLDLSEEEELLKKIDIEIMKYE